MNLKFSPVRSLGLFFVSGLLFVQAVPLDAQIPPSELPPPGTDTGLDGKYEPQNGIAQLVRGEMKGVAIIFQDDHVVVFMPPDPVVAPGPCSSGSETVRREESVGSQA